MLQEFQAGEASRRRHEQKKEKRKKRSSRHGAGQEEESQQPCKVEERLGVVQNSSQPNESHVAFREEQPSTLKSPKAELKEQKVSLMFSHMFIALFTSEDVGKVLRISG